MRIIAGKFKGRRLSNIQGQVRPTTDRLREALFSILGDTVQGSVWLDAFAGSGAVGLEALSRGASRVVFNEKDPAALRTLTRNLEISEVGGEAEVYRLDVFSCLRRLSGFTLTHIYLDPPYDFGRFSELLKKVRQCKAYDPCSTEIFLEVFKKTKVSLEGLNLELLRTVRAGDSHLLILREAGKS